MNNSIRDFFDSVLHGELGYLEIDNFIQKNTDNYKLSKLKLLLRDIEFWLFYDQNKKECETEYLIEEKIQELEKKGEQVPLIEMKTPDGKVIKFLDKEKLLFPHDFFTIYQLKNYLKKLIKESPDAAQRKKGFESKLKDNQIKSLYKQMQGNYFDTSPENLKAFLQGGNLDGIVIKWTDKSTKRHEPNKRTIYEFLYLLKEYNYIDSKEFDTTSSNPNNLYRKLETVFPDINNFPQSNPHNIQRHTDRQKGLEIIIKSL